MTLPAVNGALIEAARDGSSPAWTALVRAWGPTVLRWCRYQGGGSIDHEDAAHEVFIRLHERIGRLHSPERFRAFLYGITRRVVSEHRRRAWWRRWTPGAVPDHAGGESPERQLERAQVARTIEVVLERVPERFREVLIHCDVEGQSMAEAAELTGLPVNTVKTRLYRGRQRFRKEAARLDLTLDRVVQTPEEEALHVQA